MQILFLSLIFRWVVVVSFRIMPFRRSSSSKPVLNHEPKYAIFCHSKKVSLWIVQDSFCLKCWNFAFSRCVQVFSKTIKTHLISPNDTTLLYDVTHSLFLKINFFIEFAPWAFYFQCRPQLFLLGRNSKFLA